MDFDEIKNGIEWAKKNNKSLNDWIIQYEPIVCNAKYISHFNQKAYYDYCERFINKKLYQWDN